MQGVGARVDRRTLLRGIGAAALTAPIAMTLPACSTSFADVELRLATGGTTGEYYRLGNPLALAWQKHLGLRTTPTVISTGGSVENLRRLTTGSADVVFSQIDAAADKLAQMPPNSPDAPSALARVYDEFIQVVVPRTATVRTLADLRGARVSIGAEESGVTFVAERLLAAAGIGRTDLQVRRLGINDSVDAMAGGAIDAFFWTGAIPTFGIAQLAQRLPIQLLDLSDIIRPVREKYSVYTPGTVPASTYGIPEAITTLLVRNALLVANRMPDELAYALTETVFTTQDEVAATNPLALRIDLRAAIGFEPVPLHPGAIAYFRHAKDP